MDEPKLGLLDEPKHSFLDEPMGQPVKGLETES